jgi:hypothetical protein
MEEMRDAYNILVGKLKGRDHSDLGVDGRTMLEWMLLRYGGKVWIGCIWLRI